MINMSYGSVNECVAESDAIQRAVRAGIVPVAASGNEFQDDNPLEFPASVAHVLTVAALADNDQPTFFSSESIAVDLSAPGLNILTAVPSRPGEDFDGDGTVDGFASVSGTSFSAPMVSGAVAWIRAARPELTQDQVQNVLRFGARDVGAPGYESATGYGILSVGGALGRQAPPPDPAEPNDDIRFVNGRTFRTAAAPIFRTNGKAVALSATADVAEDPVDVYKLRLRARSRATVRLAPSIGDPDLYAYAGSASSVRRSRSVARSRQGRGPDRHGDRPQPQRPRRHVLRRGRIHREGRPRAAQRVLRAPRHAIVRRRPQGRTAVRTTGAPPAGPIALPPGRPCPPGRRASGRAGCRAGTTRRPAPPGSPCPRP